MLVSLPFIFLISLTISVAIYLVGGKLGTKGEKSVDKVAPYACGENLPPRKFQVNAEKFLIYAVYFLIFDVLAFMLATSLSTQGYFPAIYASIVFATLISLLSLWRE